MGLGDFVGGITESIGDIAGDIVGAGKNVVKAGNWAAHHIDDAAELGVKGFKYAGEAIEGTAKGVSWLATHPAYWDDAAKQMVVDQFTDPVNIATNIAMLGLTVATGGAAAPAWAAKMGLGVKALDTAAETAKVADTALDVVKGARTAEKVAEAGVEASRLERFAGGFDKALSAPSDIAKSVRSTVTGGLEKVTGGLVKQNELGLVTRGRGALAEGFLARTGGVEEGSGVLEFGRQWAGRVIGGQPGAPTTGGALAQLNYRANETAGAIKGVRDFRSNLQDTSRTVQFLADPEAAAIGLAKQHKGDIMQFAAKHAGSAIAKYLGREDEGESQDVQPTAAGMPDLTSEWQRQTDTGGMVGPRKTSQTKRLGTVEQTQVPTPNYGGYKSGRGFSSWDQQSAGMGTTPWQQDPAYS